MTSLELAPLIVAAGVALVAGLVDIVRFRVPNLITVPFLVSGLVYHAAVGGLGGLGQSAAGCLVSFVIVVILYLMGIMGAGDVKFTAGIGAWLGVTTAGAVFLVAALATALYSLAVLVYHDGLRHAAVAFQIVLCQIYRFKVVTKHLAGVESIEAIVGQSDRRRRLVPFAAMMALGVISVIVWKSFCQP